MPRPRKSSRDKPLKTLKIFCEGEKTEPNYINAYIEKFVNDAIKSRIIILKTNKNTARQLVKEAKKLKNSNTSLPEDEVWVVYDRESTAKYDEKMHADAYLEAKKAGINVAICNVCFEYWLLIHFIPTDAPYQSYDDLISNSPLNQKMNELCGADYMKSSSSLFSLVQNRVADARVRARKLNAIGIESAANGRDKPYQINPYVGIVDLLDSMDEFH